MLMRMGPPRHGGYSRARLPPMGRIRQGTWIVTAAALALAAGDASHAADPVRYRLPLNDRAVVKPKRIPFNDLTLKKIRWRHWGDKRATGTAKTTSNTCIPTCASGDWEAGTATLKVFKRHREASGGRVYGCMTGRVETGGPDGADHVAARLRPLTR